MQKLLGHLVVFFEPACHYKTPKGAPHVGIKYTGCVKNCDFRPKLPFISEAVLLLWGLIGSRSIRVSSDDFE